MEEDIDKLEELLKEFEVYGDLDGIAINDMSTYMKALEHLIKAYKELEEENMKLNQLKEKHNVRINDLCALVDNFAYNSIPVSLVEENIKELIKEGRHYNANKIEVLQELLEKRK